MGPGGPGAGPFTHLAGPPEGHPKVSPMEPDGTLAMWWPVTPDGEG